MGFNLWLVIFLALMPVFILFTGLSAAGGFQSSADWQVIGAVLAVAIVTGYLAKRRGDEISNETSIEAGLIKDAKIPVGESDPGKKFVSSLPPWFVHELDPSDLAYSNREEVVAPTFRLGFDEQKRNVSGRAIAVPPTPVLANSRSVTGTTSGGQIGKVKRQTQQRHDSNENPDRGRRQRLHTYKIKVIKEHASS